MKNLGDNGYSRVDILEENGRQVVVKRLRVPSDERYEEVLSQSGDDRNATEEYFAGFAEDLTGAVNALVLVSAKDSRYMPIIYEHSVQLSPIPLEVEIITEQLTNLDDFIQEKGMTLGGAVRVGIDVCEALIICHENGITHGGIKERNIFFREASGRESAGFKLGDAGISKILWDPTPETQEEAAFYAAPEIFKGEGAEEAGDLYAVGVILYKMLNENRMPFEPIAPPHVTVDKRSGEIRRRGGEVPPTPRKSGEKLGAIVRKICGSRDRRPKTALAMRDELIKYLDTLTDKEKNTMVLFPGGETTAIKRPMGLARTAGSGRVDESGPDMSGPMPPSMPVQAHPKSKERVNPGTKTEPNELNLGQIPDSELESMEGHNSKTLQSPESRPARPRGTRASQRTGPVVMEDLTWKDDTENTEKTEKTDSKESVKEGFRELVRQDTAEYRAERNALFERKSAVRGTGRRAVRGTAAAEAHDASIDTFSNINPEEPAAESSEIRREPRRPNLDEAAKRGTRNRGEKLDKRSNIYEYRRGIMMGKVSVAIRAAVVILLLGGLGFGGFMAFRWFTDPLEAFARRINAGDFAAARQLYDDRISGDTDLSEGAALLLLNRLQYLVEEVYAGSIEAYEAYGIIDGIGNMGILSEWDLQGPRAQISVLTPLSPALARGRDLADIGLFPEAIGELSAIHPDYPGYTRAQALLAEIIREYKDMIFPGLGADDGIVDAQSRYNQALDILFDMLEVLPGDPEVFAQIALFQGKLNALFVYYGGNDDNEYGYEDDEDYPPEDNNDDPDDADDIDEDPSNVQYVDAVRFDHGIYAGVYTGAMENGLPHGWGRIEFDNERGIYEGQWAYGRRHGFGRNEYANGDIYEGYWHESLSSGQGTMFFGASGWRAEGQWYGGRLNGPGILYDAQGNKYFEGYFVNHQRQGQGTTFFPDGTRRYDGQWYNDVEHGQGTLYDADGQVIFSGEWVNGERVEE